ncbi:MAG TPA: hypothetical protein VGE15_07230 [Sphingobacteriaceae bacterium]
MRNNLQLTIQQYLTGMLDPREMHALEKEALEDEFLAEALEGYHAVKTSHTHMSLLQQQLQARVAKNRVEKTAVRLSANRMSIAAAAGLILILSSILFWMIAFDDTPAAPQGSVPKTETTRISGSAVSPVNGWDAYDRYIRNNINTGVRGKAGKVVLELTVRNRRPENVTVVSGLSPERNAEAIRLVRNGPSWQLSGKEAGTVRLVVFFDR